jgi:translation initiation factor IF-1
MVYNAGGGNKSKGLARKFVVQAQNQGGGAGGKTVRTVKESGEQYAIVQKHLGNCMCMVYCSDGYGRLCIIRKKFTGRRKTDNHISSGSVVMVGLHDYSGSDSAGTGKGAGEVKRCDLLYVYSEQEKEKLRKVCDLSKLSASLDDSSKPGQGQGHGQLQCQEQAFEFDSNVAFITSGTGVFNKYAKDDARGRGNAADLGAALLTGSKSSGNNNNNNNNNNGTATSKNVISSTDWLDDLPPIDDDDDDDDDEGRCESEGGAEDEDDGKGASEDEEEDASEDEEYVPLNKSNPNSNFKPKPNPKSSSVINIDDI